MNGVDILKYGDSFWQRCLDGLPESEWETSGVCGVWSVKDIMAHLASHEHALVDILNTILGNEGETPYLNQLLEDYNGFNDKLVEQYKSKSLAEVKADYQITYEKAVALAAQIPAEKWHTNGILAWYGDGYDLDDFIVYTYYGHKREHGAQVAAFRDGNK